MDYETYLDIKRADLRDGRTTIGLSGDAMAHARRMALEDPEHLEALAQRDPVVQACGMRALADGSADRPATSPLPSSPRGFLRAALVAAAVVAVAAAVVATLAGVLSSGGRAPAAPSSPSVSRSAGAHPDGGTVRCVLNRDLSGRGFSGAGC